MNAQDTLFAWADGATFGGSREVYPRVPGHRNRATSRAAATAIRGRSRDLRARVLAVLRGSDATADECATVMRESVLAVRPRLTELFRLGQISDSGLTRRNASGRSATVWRVSA